jgi:formate hydrogenlyase subunit 4
MASRDSPADHLRGTMRKLTLLVAILLAASFAIADAAPKKKSAEPEDLNANSKKLLWDGLPLVMPSAVMYYMLYQKQVEREKVEKAKPIKASARKKQ